MKRTLLAALVLLATPAFAASQFGSIVETFNSLQAGPAATLSDATFAIGHVKLTMKQALRRRFAARIARSESSSKVMERSITTPRSRPSFPYSATTRRNSRICASKATRHERESPAP